LAYWLRDLRNRADLTYGQLASKTSFSRATLQEALSGRRLPTWQVTRAVVQACGGDEKLWHSYWIRIKRALDPDAPPISSESITPPWVEGGESLKLWNNSLPVGDARAEDGTREDLSKQRRRRWLWVLAGGVAALSTIAILLALLEISGPRRGTTFPNPYHHPTTPGASAVTRTYTEQEFNPNGASSFLHLDASGPGTPVAYGQLIQVSCKVYSTILKSTQPDGYWYRLASPPWDNRYYAVANTFGNGDTLNHPPYTHNVDWRVPNCK
jgi:transcriptional regulator with XRE-family HTH domain